MMRAFRGSLLAAILLLAAVHIVQAQEPKIGNIYRESVQLARGMGGVILPLPEGEWRLVAMGESRSQNNNAPMLSGRFISTDLDAKKRPKAFVGFTVAATDSFSAGWSVPRLCQAKNLHYREPAATNENRAGKEIRCWAVEAYTLKPSTKASPWVFEFYDWVGKNTAGVPLTVLHVGYARASGPKYLIADYFFNPEAAGFPRQGSVEWHRDRIVSNEKKVKYVDDLKVWGAEWAPKVEQGFAGKAP
jgi:hypothetical protein